MVEYERLLKDVSLKPTDEVLDIGCGEGSLTTLLAKSCRCALGVDPNEASIAVARERQSITPRHRANFLWADLVQAQLETGTFDRVFSFSVLEHIPHIDKTLKDVYRVLRPGGSLHFTVDCLDGIDGPDLELHRSKFGVDRYYSPTEIEDVLRTAGFQSITVAPMFTSEYARRWFLRVIHDPHERFGRFQGFLSYLRLRWEEARSTGNRGMFLVVHCHRS